MSAPTIRVLGRRIHALEPVTVVGELLGLKRAASFRAAKEQDWPRHGSRVVCPPLLDRLGIPYTLEANDDA